MMECNNECARHVMFRKKRETHRTQPFFSLRSLARACAACHTGSDMWIRDLTEEGIEPHPGPRYISKNLNGMADRARMDAVFRRIRHEHNRDPITAVFLQEHNLKTDRLRDAKASARSQRLEQVIAPIPNASHRGGTANVIPAESIEIKVNESYHQVTKRIRDSSRHLQSGRAITADMIVEGRKLRLLSAYANPDSSAAERPHFFARTLSQLVNDSTVMGIDANCVPDVTLDVKRTATSPYRNEGAQELHDLVTRHKLVDVARECLGNEPFFTSHHNVHGGGVTHTRIDQIYAPDLPGMIWEHVRVTHDFFGRPDGALELDHEPVQIRTTRITAKRGQDLQTISEDIYENIGFNTKVQETIDFIIETENPDAHGTWCATWTKIKEAVRHMSLTETSRRRYTDNQHTAQLRTQRDALKVKVDNGTADAASITQYMKLGAELAASVKDERSLYQRNEDVAYNMGKMHDVGSASFYRPWKPRGSAQWIQETFEADWTDTQNPVRTGGKCTDVKQMASEVTKY